MSGAIWLTADIFVILSAAAMARAAQTESVAWLLASLLAALLGDAHLQHGDLLAPCPTRVLRDLPFCPALPRAHSLAGAGSA